MRTDFVPTEAALTYLAGRGIDGQTARRFGITSQRERENILVFPFFSPNGELQFVKYRKTDYQPGRDACKEWCQKGGTPVLFGMNQCRDRGRLCVTEGQIDSLTLSACGIENAVSVPTGALGFTWAERCRAFVEEFSEIMVFGDCEGGKVTLAEGIAWRFSQPVRVVRPEDYLGEKDANALLCRYGADAVRRAVERAVLLPAAGMKELAEVRTVDVSRMARISTGIRELDRLIGGFFFGKLTVLTGRRGEGKSTLMGQFMLEALDQGYKTLAYSGELQDFHFKRWLDLQAAGPEHLIRRRGPSGEEIYMLPEEIVERLNDWYRGRAFLYDAGGVDMGKKTGLLDEIEGAAARYKIKFLCIDNLMTALQAGPGEDLYRAQSRFVQRLKGMAMELEMAVLLVVHPRKAGGSLDNDAVMGSSDITNMADVVLAYEREDGTVCDGKLSVLKNRMDGRLTRRGQEIRLYYSRSARRISSLESGRKQYGWERREEKGKGGNEDEQVDKTDGGR